MEATFVPSGLLVQVPSCHSRCLWHQKNSFQPLRAMLYRSSSESLSMFPRSQQRVCQYRKSRWSAMLSGGGFLGVGAPELVVVIVVGWLLLGPRKLYELARDAGNIIGQIRKTAAEAQDTFSEALAMDLEEAQEKQNATVTDRERKNLGRKEREEEKVKVEEEEILEDSHVDKILEKTVETLEQNTGGTSGDWKQPDTKLEYVEHIPEKTGEVPEAYSKGTAAGRRQQEDIASRRVFLDQLMRAQDPNQSPPENGIPEDGQVPDLDVSVEMELEELDRQYREARQRLLEKRGKKAPNRAAPEQVVSDIPDPHNN